MKVVTLELNNDDDVDLLTAFAKRIDGEILSIRETGQEIKQGPVYWLEEIAKQGGIKNIKNPSKWQQEQRKDKTLVNR